jgi:hypothetical protein
MKTTWIALALAGSLLGACGNAETPSAAPDGDAQRVPDVVHMDLREGAAELEDAGFRVALDPSLGADGYVDTLAGYMRGQDIGIDPQPYIGETDPAPGSEADEGSTVTITALECPEQAASCD